MGWGSLAPRSGGVCDLATIIGKDAVVPLGIVGVVAVTVVSVCFWLKDEFNDLGRKVDLMGRDIGEVRRDVSDIKGDQWGRGDMRAWLLLFEAKNPDLTVPGIDD